MGPTRRQLTKPVIAAVEGHAVAGGLELAIWCDLRVAAEDAIFGVFCRRWGVPLIDGGTVRLPRLIGQSRALDLVLTGRAVGADEALGMGLVNRVVPSGTARAAAVALATEVAALPQGCLRSDRASLYAQWDRSLDARAGDRDHAWHGRVALGRGARGRGSLHPRLRSPRGAVLTFIAGERWARWVPVAQICRLSRGDPMARLPCNPIDDELRRTWRSRRATPSPSPDLTEAPRPSQRRFGAEGGRC